MNRSMITLTWVYLILVAGFVLTPDGPIPINTISTLKAAFGIGGLALGGYHIYQQFKVKNLAN